MTEPSEAVEKAAVPTEEENRSKFRNELRDLINIYSMENGSDTPDFILAEFLSDSLKAFDNAVFNREKRCGRKIGEWE